MTQEVLDRMFQKKDIKPTAMRQLVLDFLLKQESAITLSCLEDALYPSDRITLYRSIKTFEEKGLVHSIDDGTGIKKYALCKEDCNSAGHHDVHVHFFCNECKNTLCLPKTQIPEITLPHNFKPQEVNLLIKGICNTCSIL
jgi:Fur family ferric uptake transcriptional regulator